MCRSQQYGGIQPRSNMATGILLELDSVVDTLSETLEYLSSLFPIILMILRGIIKNNWEQLRTIENNDTRLFL